MPQGLSSCIGAGEFVAHPDGVHLGLSVAQGQDGTNSYWLHLDEGGIVVRELPGEALAGVAPSGVHYLDLPHLGTQLAIRRFTDYHVLVGVFTAGYHRDETELHLVLSTRSLRWVATVDSGRPGPPPANSIVPGHDGRWLTYDWQAGIATLWEPCHITQEALFDVP